MLVALVIEWQKITGLRWAVCWLSGGTVLLLIIPGPFAVELGQRVVFNPLLAEYGLPVIAFAVIAWAHAAQ